MTSWTEHNILSPNSDHKPTDLVDMVEVLTRHAHIGIGSAPQHWRAVQAKKEVRALLQSPTVGRGKQYVTPATAASILNALNIPCPVELVPSPDDGTTTSEDTSDEDEDVDQPTLDTKHGPPSAARPDEGVFSFRAPDGSRELIAQHLRPLADGSLPVPTAVGIWSQPSLNKDSTVLYLSFVLRSNKDGKDEPRALPATPPPSRMAAERPREDLKISTGTGLYGKRMKLTDLLSKMSLATLCNLKIGETVALAAAAPGIGRVPFTTAYHALNAACNIASGDKARRQ